MHMRRDIGLKKYNLIVRKLFPEIISMLTGFVLFLMAKE